MKNGLPAYVFVCTLLCLGGALAIHRSMAQGANTATPVVALEAAPTSGPAPLIVNFRVAAAIAAEVDFGDGSKAALIPVPVCRDCPPLSVASHEYVRPGSFTARLLYRDAVLGTQVITVLP